MHRRAQPAATCQPVVCNLARRSVSRSIATGLLVLVAFGPSAAVAYRPFVSTDAAVAESGEAEVEFGYIGFRRDHGESTIVAPTVIANLGLGRDFELVTETKVTHDLAAPVDRSQAEDTAVSVKWVAREGVLQNRGLGPSVGVELSLLVPTANYSDMPAGSSSASRRENPSAGRTTSTPEPWWTRSIPSPA